MQKHLASMELSGAVLLCTADIAWLTGFYPSLIAPNMAFFAAYLPTHGNVQLVAMAGYTNAMRESTWSEVTTIDSPQAVISALVNFSKGTGRIGVEHSMGLQRAASANEIDALETGLGRERLVDISAMIWQCRMVKTDWEMQQYRKLGEITAIGFNAGLAMIGENVSEQEIERAMWAALIDAGADAGPKGGQLMIRSGRERYPVYCGAASGRKIADGDQVMLAGGPVFNGYHIDIHRFSNVGEVSDLQSKLYQQSRAGIDAALAVICPGITTGQIFETASQAMREIGASDEMPWRVMGHGIGLENYEYPMIVENGDVELVAGMALAIEVPAYDVPEFRVLGAFLEECILVTDKGCEVLTCGVSRDLHVVL